MCEAEAGGAHVSCKGCAVGTTSHCTLAATLRPGGARMNGNRRWRVCSTMEAGRCCEWNWALFALAFWSKGVSFAGSSTLCQPVHGIPCAMCHVVKDLLWPGKASSGSMSRSLRTVGSSYTEKSTQISEP